MKRIISMFLVLAMLMVFCAGCQNQNASNPTKPDESNSGKGALTLSDNYNYRDNYKTYFTSEYPSLNYFTTVYAGVRGLMANCIDGLVEPDKYGVYKPSLAESWEVNDDYTVWTFHIRKGVNWVNNKGEDTGYKVTAEDFVDAIRYIGDPRNDAYSLRVVRSLITGLNDYYWNLSDIDDPDVTTDLVREDVIASFDEAVGVKALDEYTVQYTLNTSAPYFLSLIESSMLLLPVEYKYAMELGENFGIDPEHLLYCGAYYISDFSRDKKITLTANPHYWDAGNVTVKTIEYQKMPDGTTALEMFKRGEIDDCVVESEEYSSMQGTEWAEKLAPTEFDSSTNYLWLDFESKNPEFKTFVNNENFRRALQYAIDRESIAYLRDSVNPARLIRNTICAEKMIYDSNGKDYTDYEALSSIKNTNYSNSKLARQYMEKAVAELCDAEGNIKGVKATKVDMLPIVSFDVDGKLPVTVMYVGTDDEDEIIMAQLIKAMLEEALGTDYIDVQLAFCTSSFYSTVADPLNYDMYYDSLSVTYSDPSCLLSRMTTDGAENVGKYNVPEYDKLIEQALDTSDIEERYKLFSKAEAYLINGAYVIPMISSLRGYFMTRCIPHTEPLTLYGNTRYKGMMVTDKVLTAEEIAAYKVDYETKKAAALAGN